MNASVDAEPVAGREAGQPVLPSPRARDAARDRGTAPAVVAAECESLRRRTAAVARGEALLVLAGGHVPEPLAEASVTDRLAVLSRMALVLGYAAGLPVVKVGWTVGGSAGQAGSGGGPGGPGARAARERAAVAMNLVRACSAGEFTDGHQVRAWLREVAGEPGGGARRALAAEIDRALAFLGACGVDTRGLGAGDCFVAYEAGVPEGAASRSAAGRLCRSYAADGHLLWAGGVPDGRLARVGNSLAVAIDPVADLDRVPGLLDRLDPRREPGRLTLVVRSGADRIHDTLPALVEKVAAEGADVCWVSDPPADGGRPGPRSRVHDEVSGFVAVHRALGTHPGGVRVDVGAVGAARCLEVAFALADAYRGHPPPVPRRDPTAGPVVIEHRNNSQRTKGNGGEHMPKTESGRAVTDDTKRSLLRHMLVARGVDEEARQLQKQGALDLWLSCQGQEAAQVGSALAVGAGPAIFPSYREHAVALVRGVAPEELLAQWAGRTYCGWDPWLRGFFPYTLVLAAQTLHGVGYSIGRRLRGQDDFVVVYVGDGATSEGDMSEAMNLAAVESAAVLFICQNNGWAISKPAAEQMRTSVAERARGFGIEASLIPGQDPDLVYAECARAAAQVREAKAPYLIEMKVGRVNGHSTSDAQELYRGREDIERTAAADPVVAYVERLTGAGVVDSEWLRTVDADVREIRQQLMKRYT
ncbi:thiamine pyrophosphate-dependent enzyme [Streptomyces viridochromogenes]|nr:thiamine pyrophosphate-dependent enzyme [Streptomyces viridochromogenes]